MSDYPVKNVVVKPAHHYFFSNRCCPFFSFVKRKEIIALLFLFFCLSAQLKVNAQDDSGNNADDETTTDTTIMADTASYDSTIPYNKPGTENGFDTTGYYFNQKSDNKDAFTDTKLNPRASSDTTVQRLRKEDDFWYVKSIEEFKNNITRLRTDKAYRDSLRKAGLLPPDDPDFVQEPRGNEWYAQSWFNILIWVVIVALFAGAVIYFLSSNKINIFSRTVAKRRDEEEVGEENLFTTNYDSLLAKYVEEKNYRLAVRVLYLQLLKMLSERSVIMFQPQFTNTQYLRQLATTSLYGDFFTVTRHYEYVWYGEFSLSDTAFEKINSDFAKVKKEVLRK